MVRDDERASVAIHGCAIGCRRDGGRGHHGGRYGKVMATDAAGSEHPRRGPTPSIVAIGPSWRSGWWCHGCSAARGLRAVRPRARRRGYRGALDVGGLALRQRDSPWPIAHTNGARSGFRMPPPRSPKNARMRGFASLRGRSAMKGAF